MNRNQPIGVFDSGLGGLTVLKELQKELPNESYIYFGDTANVPYGSKSVQKIQNYSTKITQFLLKNSVKIIVIACNTASSISEDLLKDKLNIPIFGVVNSSVNEAIKYHKAGKIGVIGTQSTIASNRYLDTFKSIAPHIETIHKACPLFVPLIEENWIKSKISKQIVSIYLQPLIKHQIDALVLGCTHYPIMEGLIQQVVGDSVQLISSGPAISQEVKSYLIKNNLQATINNIPAESFFVTDFPQKFDRLGSQFLGRNLKNVKHIKLT